MYVCRRVSKGCLSRSSSDADLAPRACVRRSKRRVVVRFVSLVYDPKCCGVSPKISPLLSRLELQQQQRRQPQQQRRVSGFGFGAASSPPSAAAFSGGLFGSAAPAAGGAFGSSAPPPPPEAKAAVAQVEGGDGAFGAVTFVVDKPANVK